MMICFTTSVGAFRLQSLLDNLLRSSQNRINVLNQPLVNPHLESIPSLATLTTRRLSRCDLQMLCRQADGTLHAQVLRLGAVDELRADFLEGLDVAAGESDSNLMYLLW